MVKKDQPSILAASYRNRDSLDFTVFKRAFSMFDNTKSGSIEKEKVRTILNTLGHTFDDIELDVLLKQEDDAGIVSLLAVRPGNSSSSLRCISRQCYSNFWSSRWLPRVDRWLRSTERGQIIHDIMAETRECTCIKATKAEGREPRKLS